MTSFILIENYIVRKDNIICFEMIRRGYYDFAIYLKSGAKISIYNFEKRRVAKDWLKEEIIPHFPSFVKMHSAFVSPNNIDFIALPSFTNEEPGCHNLYIKLYDHNDYIRTDKTFSTPQKAFKWYQKKISHEFDSTKLSKNDIYQKLEEIHDTIKFLPGLIHEFLNCQEDFENKQ